MPIRKPDEMMAKAKSDSANSNALPKGVRLIDGYLDAPSQAALLADIRSIVAAAPLYHPAMPRSGKKMSVAMTNCGQLGWLTDKEKGYRYQETHPETGKPWPEMPDSVKRIWTELAGYPQMAQACLINFYNADARMGLHQDRDEEDFSAPIVSISLGDDCLFRVGGAKRGDRTVSFRLSSGDAVVLAGPARLAHHGVDRIYPGTSMLLKNGGRVNLTLRRVTRAA